MRGPGRQGAVGTVPADRSMPASGGRGEGRQRASRGDLAFFCFLAAYAGFALTVLAAGVVAAVAAAVPALHEALHERGVLHTLVSRGAEAMARASHHTQPPLQLTIDYGFSAFNLALAGFLIWLRPRERTARLLVLGMIGTAVIFNLQAYGVYEQFEGRLAAILVHDAFHLVASVSYVLALLLFPDGRLVPRWPLRPLVAFHAAAAAAVAALGYGLLSTSRTLAIVIVFGLLAPAVGVASQAYRYGRSASAVERQQARLLFWALSPALVLGAVVLTQGLTGSAVEVFEGRALTVIPVELFRVFQPTFAIIPIALFAGILRFRLWDIDRIVSRTVTYVLLSGLLVATYAVGVMVLGWLLAPLGAGSDLAAAGATLLAAALLSPARRRIQAVVDRRFNRARYDAQREVDAFRARLRDQLDLDDLRGELLTAIRHTVQPACASVWLRPEGNGHLPAQVTAAAVDRTWARTPAVTTGPRPEPDQAAVGAGSGTASSAAMWSAGRGSEKM